MLSVLLSFRSLLASPTLEDATAMPANLEAASLLVQAPQSYRRRNEAIAERMPAW